MADGIHSSLELDIVFRQIDEVIHNLEMYAKGENVELDKTDLKPLFENVIKLIVVKINYYKSRFIKLYELKDRLYGLEVLYLNNKRQEDIEKGIIDNKFYGLIEKIEDLVDNVINPFLQRHREMYEPEERNIMAFVNQKEYDLIEKKELLEESELLSEKKVIVWNGTPGEFGAIMGELIKNGFIPKIKDLKNTVRILNGIFEIRNEQGEIVDDGYLYKCFGEKKKSYFPHEFKLPISDNFNKIK